MTIHFGLTEQSPLRSRLQQEVRTGQGLLRNDQRAAVAASRLVTLIAENRVSEARVLLRAFVSQGIESAALWRLSRVLEPPVARKELVCSAPLPSGRLPVAEKYVGKWLALRGSSVVAAADRIDELESQVAGFSDRKDLAFFWATK